MRSSTFVSAVFSLAALVSGAPTPVELEERAAVSGSAVASVNVAVNAGNPTSILKALSSVTPTATPTAISQALSSLSAIHAASPTNIWSYNAALVSNGLVSSNVASLASTLASILSGGNSMLNVNLRSPSTTIYPKKSSSDAPYDVLEATLRAAIYIPSGFTYGTKPPVILFPGTGATGYGTFVGNFIPLLQASSWADPVWVNVPGFLLNDAQTNAEYAAYAINYIAGITKQNVTVVAWSQGNIDVQWAFKYWPSTRNVTSDHVAISPDYAGTIEADFICPNLSLCDPSVFQQRYLSSSNFITQLRKTNGDSAYVPTTTLYSALFDEIVEPQQGTGASAYLLDARGVGVTNNEVQSICPGQPAGSFYTHESMLINPLSFALLQDAMTHSGPGQVSRISLSTVCAQYAAPGITLTDFLLTENSILMAGINLLLYVPKVAAEPAIKSYATY